MAQVKRAFVITKQVNVTYTWLVMASSKKEAIDKLDSNLFVNESYQWQDVLETQVQSEREYNRAVAYC